MTVLAQERMSRDRSTVKPAWRAETAVGALAVLAAGPFAAMLPEPGLERGWQLGLTLAELGNFEYGDDVAFTFGPWGYLDYPFALTTTLVVLGSLFRLLGLCVLFASVRRALWEAPAGLARCVAVLVTVGLGSWSSPDWMLCIGLGALIAQEILVRGRVGRRTAVASSAVLPLLFLVKVSSGLIGVLVLLVSLLVGRQWRLLFECCGLMAASLLGWWLAAGQSAVDLAPWLSTIWQVVAGYPEAMSDGGFTGWRLTICLAVAVAGLIGLRDRTLTRDGLLRAVPVISLLFLAARASLVRNDAMHYGLLVLALVVLSLVGARGWGRRLKLQLAVASVTAVVGTLMAHQAPPTPHEWATQSWQALSPSARERAVGSAADRARDQYAASDTVLRSIGDHPVVMDPWEIGFVWAYDLEWRPVRTLQSYAAYTPELDDLAARDLLEEPDLRVVRERAALHERSQLWESPNYNVTMLCRFAQVAADDRWTVFAPAGDRCSSVGRTPPRAVDAGDAVEIPQTTSDQAVLMSFSPDDRSLWQGVFGAMVKPTSPLLVSLGSADYRIPRALAGQGALVRVPSTETWMSQSLADGNTLRFSEAGLVSFEVLQVSQPWG